MADERAGRSKQDTLISSVNSARMRTATGGSLVMNVRTGGPHLLLFERNQQVITLLTSQLQLAGYEGHTARTAVEVFDTIARHPVRLVLVNLAQAAAVRREFWVALDAQRRGRSVQVLTYRCTNLAGYGAQDPDERGRLAQADIEVDGMLGVMNLVDAVRARLPAATTGSPSRVSWAQASSRPSTAAVPFPTAAPNSALAALASSSPPSGQQPLTTAPPFRQESASNVTQTDTDWVRAIIYPSQSACNPPGSSPVNTPDAASALQPTSSEGGEESGLEQLSRLVRMQSPPPQNDVPREVRPEPQEHAVSPSGQAGEDVLAPASATFSGLPVEEAGKKVLAEGKSTLASALPPSVKVAVHRALRLLLPRWLQSETISKLEVKVGPLSGDKVEQTPQVAEIKDNRPVKDEHPAQPREDTPGSPVNKQVLPRYLLPLTIANTIILLVLLILLLIIATRFLSP